jgi:PncC family amidohydrolase
MRNKILNFLQNARKTIATIESFTAGNVAQQFIRIPGASSVFKQGLILYQKEAKAKFLNLDGLAINKIGVVSKAMIQSLLVQGLKQSLADILIITTGYAGPTADADGKVGKAWIGIGDQQHQKIVKYHFNGSRLTIQKLGAKAAIDLLEKFLSDYYDMKP